LVTIRRGHFRFTTEDANNWLSKFGSIVEQARFVLNVVVGCVFVHLIEKSRQTRIVDPLSRLQFRVADPRRLYQVFRHIYPRTISKLLIVLQGYSLALLVSRSLCHPIHIVLCCRQVKGADGLFTEAVEAEIVLKDFIPEWLPIKGCRERVYHHGIKTQCNNCYQLGHFGKDCKAPKKTWTDYVNYLWETRNFEKEMFGNLLEAKATPPSNPEDELKAILASGVDLKRLVAALKAPGDPKPKLTAKRGRPTSAKNAQKKPKTKD